MKSLTRQKRFEEVKRMSDGLDRVFIIGCGTCATMAKTGGVEEVGAMKARLQEAGKLVTGAVVIPTACDEMTAVLLEENKAVEDARCIVVMACALGVQRVNLYLSKPVLPALDTLFIGMEKSPGYFFEACDQCGQCILGETAGICPLTACHKGLLNGPCGGTDKGKCESIGEGLRFHPHLRGSGAGPARSDAPLSPSPESPGFAPAQRSANLVKKEGS